LNTCGMETRMRATDSTSATSVYGRLAILGVGLVLEATIVASVHWQSVFHFLFFFVATLLIYRALVEGDLWEPAAVYVVYSAWVLVLYGGQWLTLPEYYGFSGGLGVGTDDSFYYSLVAQTLPAGFPTRPGFWERYKTFAQLLTTITPGPIHHPFDVIFANAFAATFIPIFTRRLAVTLTGQTRVGRLAFILALICPFTIAMSAVLIRDGWTAALFTGGALFVLRSQALRAAVLGSLLLFLRLGSGLLWLGFILPLTALLHLGRKRAAGRKALAVGSGVLLLVAMTVVLYPVVAGYLSATGLSENLFLRQQLVETFTNEYSEGALVGRIYALPIGPRLVTGFLYYLAVPFVSPHDVIVSGTFVPRALLLLVFATLFLVYIKFFLQGAFEMMRHKDPVLLVTVLGLLFLLLVLSQLSIQIRHKVMVMPLIYVVTAFGVYNHSAGGRLLGTAGAAVLVLTNLARLFWIV